MSNYPAEFLNDDGFKWSTLSGRTWTVWYIGRKLSAEVALAWLETAPEGWAIADISELLSSLPNGWALCALSADRLIASVDKIRSYPLFYTEHSQRMLVSNSARLLRAKIPGRLLSVEALVEFGMGGYVTGSDTLYAGLKQLQAGELLITQGQDMWSHRYYRYLPQPVKAKEGHLIDELAETTESIFRRLIDEAGGRQLLVPLSGGLDSRLIVCMLKYLRYDNVRTFSYGPRGNYEAKIAKHVAKQVGYPWEFIETTHSGFREYFWSPARQDYWKYSDGLCTIPNMQDIYALLRIRERNLSEDVIIVNGQSGDFISGGHIPACLLPIADKELMLGALIEKHFSLRKSLKTEDNKASVARRIMSFSEELEAMTGCELQPAALYESWEWQERQCKYVIGGQRAYDWLGLTWQLPLWDAEYLHFWSKVPFELKFEQRLYKKYLRARDYCGMFRSFNPTVWRWPGVSLAMVPIANLMGLLGGRRTKERVYEYARYIGHYGPNYAPWGWLNFYSQATDIRNPVSFLVSAWLSEHGVGDLNRHYH